MAPVYGQIVFMPNELDRLLRKPGGPVGRYCNLVARRVANQSSLLARQRLQVRTGRYAGGFRVKVAVTGGAEGFRFWVVNTTTGQDPRRKTPYSAVIELGSRPHWIEPRRRPHKVLVFRLPDGRKIVTQQVWHPGTKPQFIMRDAMERVFHTL